jgi:ech hydrogenase subunit D
MTLVSTDQLEEKMSELKNANARLVQICCTKTDGFELTYSFDTNGEFFHVRLLLGAADELNSITSIFPSAFLYENEMMDLFGIPIRNVSIDFKRNLYKLSTPAPFGYLDPKEGDNNG